MQQLYNFSHPLVAGSMRHKDCYVNAGVYLLDLVRYRQVRGGVLLRARDCWVLTSRACTCVARACV